MASLTRWTWVWVNPGSWWWTRRSGVLWFMGSQRVRHNWATELNWTGEYTVGKLFNLPMLLFPQLEWKLFAKVAVTFPPILFVKWLFHSSLKRRTLMPPFNLGWLPVLANRMLQRQSCPTQALHLKKALQCLLSPSWKPATMERNSSQTIERLQTTWRERPCGAGSNCLIDSQHKASEVVRNDLGYPSLNQAPTGSTTWNQDKHSCWALKVQSPDP